MGAGAICQEIQSWPEGAIPWVRVNVGCQTVNVGWHRTGVICVGASRNVLLEPRNCARVVMACTLPLRAEVNHT